MGVASFPLVMEEPNFATGALNVNPAYKQEKEKKLLIKRMNDYEIAKK